jgi:hypothetical protein
VVDGFDFRVERVVRRGGFDVVLAVFVERVDFSDKFYRGWNDV